MNNNPKISIVTVVFNGVEFLEDTIKSVINQTYDNIEYIIIDGGSTDGTVDIIKKYEDKIAYWVSEPDKGIYDAWNKGIEASSGEWIAFLGSDDCYLKNAITDYMYFIKQSKTKIDYISSKVELVDKNMHPIKLIGKAWKWSVFKRYMGVAHVGSLHNRSYFDRFGKYDDNYLIAGDYEMLLRKGKELKAGFINIVTVKMRNGGVSNIMIPLTLKETMNAKYNTGGRRLMMVKLEYNFAIFKNYLKYIIGYKYK